MAYTVPTYKVILCGEFGAGKSSIFRRFLDNSFAAETRAAQSTIGLDHFGKNFVVNDTKAIKLVLWDTAGIERFATLSSSYFQSAQAAILCYDIGNRDSFGILSQHILEIVMHSETAKIFLCGNKVDMEATSEEPVTGEDVEDFQQQCAAVLSGTYRISCLSGEGVKEMFEDIAAVLLKQAELRFDPSKIQPGFDETPTEEKKKGCCRT